MEEVQATETKSTRKVKKSREVNTQEAQEYLMRPIPKISDPNKALKKAYEKGHLDDSKFEFMKELKDIRAKKKDDSVSSHGATDDEDFNIVEEQARKVPKQANVEEEQIAEKTTKKKRKKRFAVKLQKLEVEMKNEEAPMKQEEIDSSEANENITKNQDIQERESQQTESKSTEKIQEIIQSAAVVQPKEKKVQKSTGKRGKKEEGNVKLSQGEIQPADKGVEEKVLQSGSGSKPNPSLQTLKQPNNQVQQAQSSQIEDPRVKEKAAQPITKHKRLTRQSIMQAEMRIEQQKGQNFKPEGKDIIKSRTKSRQRRVNFSANEQDEKKPVQRRRRKRQQNSVSTPKEKIQVQAENNIQIQPTIPSNAQVNVVAKRRRAARKTNPNTNNTEKPTKPSNNRSQSKAAPQSKVVRDQSLPKSAEKTTEIDKKGRLSINSKVVIESLNFFELKRKSFIKQKKKHAKKYYVQSQSDDDEEYPPRRRKASKAKRYRKICIEESDDSSDDIIERRRRHSKKDKQRRKRRYSSSEDDMSDISESHLYRTNQHNYRSRDPKGLKFELKQEQR